MSKTIVFTNGCFDIIHPGHIYLLKKAKTLGDILIVGLNSDASVSRLKPNRPINNFEYRKTVLSSIKYVDLVIGFNEDTPIRLIYTLEPNVLVKGGDWPIDKIIGADFVKSQGGTIFSIPFESNYSTTGLIKKIKEMDNSDAAISKSESYSM